MIRFELRLLCLPRSIQRRRKLKVPSTFLNWPFFCFSIMLPVFWMHWNARRGRNGGVLEAEMELGKVRDIPARETTRYPTNDWIQTIMALAIALLETFLHRAHAEVNSCRNAPPGSPQEASHLPASTKKTPRSPDAKAPSDPSWPSCPCLQCLSATQKTLKLGCLVLLIPPGLHQGRTREIKKLVNEEELKILGIECVHSPDPEFSA